LRATRRNPKEIDTLHVTKRSAWFMALLLAFALVGAACSDSKSNTTTSASSSASAAQGANIDYSSLSGTLNGSGSTFQDAFNQKAITQFKTKAGNVAVSYTKSGSGAGKTDLQNKVVQFAGTDSLIADADKPKFQGGDVLYFPTVGAPITVSFNVSGVDKLQLSGETLGGIFAGAITTWNDPKIAADNSGVNLPNKPIVVVHRSDASGTTNNFTRFLTKAGGSAWTLNTGDTVNWPSTTQGAEKNSGVAQLITSTDGAIGYVDLADAVNANLKFASVKNSAGKFIAPTLDAAGAALSGATVKDDLTYDPINATGDTAYPITSPTWIIVYKKQPDANTAAALKGFLTFLLTDGQGFANTVGFAKLPTDLTSKAIAQLDQITTG
jgi:phosphate transport system substrate-binding protein